MFSQILVGTRKNFVSELAPISARKPKKVAHPCTRLYVDTSNFAVGGTIVQAKSNGDHRPIAFFSKTLTPAQKSCPAFHKKLLAICSAINHFWYFFEGREFTIYTDRKPLIPAIFSTFKRRDLSLPTKQLEFISQFSTDISWIEGLQNVVADCLSRQPQSVPIQDDLVGREDGRAISELSQVNILFSRDSYVDYISIAHEQTGDFSIEKVGNNSINLEIVKKELGHIRMGVYVNE